MLAGQTRGQRRRRSDETGATAVEFALILVPFLVVVFGIIQYGVYFWAVQGGSAAAREAARDAATGDHAACAAFRTDVGNSINAMVEGTPTITRDFKNASGVAVQPGDDVTVTVVFNTVDFHFPFLPFVNDGVVSSSATARVEYVPTLTIGDCT